MKHSLLAFYLYVELGTIPSTLCNSPVLIDLELTNSGSNAGLICTPACLSTVTTIVAPSSACPSSRDVALCSLIAATNVQSITSYSNWNCTTLGTTYTNPCTTPIWTGLTCSGSNVLIITLSALGLIGTIPSGVGSLISLMGLDLHNNKLIGIIISSVYLYVEVPRYFNRYHSNIFGTFK